MKLPLKLRYVAEAMHEPAAWFLPGSEPAQWLPEIAAWDGDHRQTKLRLVPRSMNDRTVCGVLVTMGKDTSGRPSPRPSPEGRGRTGIPYGCLAGQLYLPIDAVLDPPLTNKELQDLLVPGRQYVFHPQAGLVAFDRDELRSLTDLWEQPVIRPTDCSLAQPGLSLNDRLHSVRPLTYPSADEIISTSGGDIGSEASQGHAPEPQENEPQSGMLGDAARTVLGGIAGGIGWLASQIPSGMVPGFLSGAADWAAKKMEQIGLANEFLRNQELGRLMKMLQDNPDEGLKYALPLADMNRSRGIAPPSNRLLPRLLDFRIGGWGSGPADVWNIDARRQAELHRRYRELAEREMNLGRYRRAAYIYAHLLGDVLAAANALRTGKHFREAAVLFRDKLRRPADAAKCLIDGGLLSEAIPILMELQQYEEAGQLHERLDEMEEAHAAYRQAVARMRSQSNYLEAARILEDRLHVPEEALESLAAAWPDSHQAEACLQKLWTRLDQAGRHEDLRQRMLSVRDQTLRSHPRAIRAKMLSQWANSAGDLTVRDFAGDAVRIVASRELPTADLPEVRLLMSAVRDLAEGDKLLGRDTARYLRQRTEPKPLPAKTIKTSGPRLVRCIVLWSEQPATWLSAVKVGETMCVFGTVDHRLIVGRANWDGTCDITRLKWTHLDGMALVVAADPLATAIYAHLPQEIPGNFHLAGTNEFKCIALKNAPPVSGRLIGMSAGFNRIDTICVDNSGCVLHSFNHRGKTMHSLAMPPHADDLPLKVPVPMTSGRHNLFIGWGTKLLKGSDRQPIEFGRQIHSLSTSPQGSIPHVAIGFATGGLVYWPESRQKPLRFAEDVSHFLTGFTRGGHLVVASEAGCEVYDTREHEVRLVTKFAAAGSKPISILPSAEVNQFAVIHEDGRVLVYEV